ncbi:hypothetical protein P7K49_004873 [Saguinus oedipus]|uniref:C2H2-type domain-containing protein n=1 Tax=Saguinus oedipus TaxID=9490 RepID=A0ABQ9W8P4_SAGOE|nr:hypothetical protein P7K49_004873 [Saguinus oedipus]
MIQQVLLGHTLSFTSHDLRRPRLKRLLFPGEEPRDSVVPPIHPSSPWSNSPPLLCQFCSGLTSQTPPPKSAVIHWPILFLWLLFTNSFTQNNQEPSHKPNELCGKEFNRMHNLMGHMHLHSDSKPFKCLYCPSKFTLKGNLTRHMKVKHGVMERGLHSQGNHSPAKTCESVHVQPIPGGLTIGSSKAKALKIGSNETAMLKSPYLQPCKLKPKVWSSQQARWLTENHCGGLLLGLGRGRIALAQTAGVLRSLEQEEPFDLSQKRRVKGPVFQSDGESTRGSPCHEEEEEDNCFEVEPYSPGLAPQSQELCTPEDLSTKPEHAPEVLEEACKEKEEASKEEWEERSKGDLGAEGSQERDCAGREECLGLRAFPSTRRGPSFSDYLYFKHRDESLKELLERKMEKQAMLLGV